MDMVSTSLADSEGPLKIRLQTMQRPITTKAITVKKTSRLRRRMVPARLAEAPSHGLPVTVYDRTSRGAAAYKQVAEELSKKL